VASFQPDTEAAIQREAGLLQVQSHLGVRPRMLLNLWLSAAVCAGLSIGLWIHRGQALHPAVITQISKLEGDDTITLVLTSGKAWSPVVGDPIQVECRGRRGPVRRAVVAVAAVPVGPAREGQAALRLRVATPLSDGNACLLRLGQRVDLRAPGGRLGALIPGMKPAGLATLAASP
jgi:hypothetical protein